MAWTEEDRRRVSEQNSRVQRARDQAFQAQQQTVQARQAQRETQRTEAHERHMKQIRDGARTWGNTPSLPFSQSTKVQHTFEDAPSRSRAPRENQPRAKSFWLLCGFAMATYFIYQWQLPRTGLVGMSGVIPSAISVVVGAGVIYALRRLIVFVLKWTFILAILGGLIYLYSHRK